MGAVSCLKVSPLKTHVASIGQQSSFLCHRHPLCKLHIWIFHDIIHTACEFLEFPRLIMLSSLEFALGAVVSSFMLLAVSCCVRWVFTLDFRNASKHVDKG